MLSIELDPFDQSLRKRSALKNCPILKRRFLAMVVAIAAIVLLFIAFREMEVADRLFQVAVALVFIPFLAWALFHTPLVAIGSSAEAFDVLSSKTHIYTYKFSSRALIETTNAGEKLYPIEEYVGTTNESGNLMVVFEKGLVYLPFRTVREGSIEEFMGELRRHVTSQGSRDAVTGAPA